MPQVDFYLSHRLGTINRSLSLTFNTPLSKMSFPRCRLEGDLVFIHSILKFPSTLILLLRFLEFILSVLSFELCNLLRYFHCCFVVLFFSKFYPPFSFRLSRIMLFLDIIRGIYHIPWLLSFILPVSVFRAILSVDISLLKFLAASSLITYFRVLINRAWSFGSHLQSPFCTYFVGE